MNLKINWDYNAIKRGSCREKDKNKKTLNNCR